MRKTVLILALLFALAATPALANQGRGTSNEKANDHAKSTIIEDIEVNPTEVTPTEVTPTNVTPSPSKQPCDPDDEYENHGNYVSCVARSHQGGKITSEAAKSHIGKKDHDRDDDDDDVTPSPSVSPSVSPTITGTPTATPSVSPSVEPSPSASPSGTPEGNALIQQIQDLIDKLKNLLESLKNFATL